MIFFNSQVQWQWVTSVWASSHQDWELRVPVLTESWLVPYDTTALWLSAWPEPVGFALIDKKAAWCARTHLDPQDEQRKYWQCGETKKSIDGTTAVYSNPYCETWIHFDNWYWFWPWTVLSRICSNNYRQKYEATRILTETDEILFTDLVL